MATYEEVKDIPKHPEKYLIEVRNKDEIAQTGEIPGSINIPLPELEDALEATSEQFKLRFKREKPNKDSPIIFTCRSGRRALTATNTAKSMGYTNIKTYAGSWLEWSKKEGI